jgi:DNA-binding response OmpR family regulator
MNETCRILVAEDDPALAELLQEYLCESNYHITLHTRGDTALEHLGRERFDLVLSDIMLPGVDGISILRHVVAEHTPEQTLVLLMTGYSGIDDALHAIEKGAYDFVSKPFRLPEIRVRLDNAARYQRLLRLRQGMAQKDLQAGDSPRLLGQRVGDRSAVQAYIRTEAA